METLRANPDELLKIIKQGTEMDCRGHLKIFFGYAAGVGKTYAMLKAAHSAKERGINVMIGYVEPHQRPQTNALMQGLEKLSPLKAVHKGIRLQEFNLDAALERKPELILVDELAHTNAAICRHAKRYQDIEELLKNGIDVYTTVNVQHLESINDIVAAITGVRVRERIPDSVFDQANQVELVDLEPEELINRLHAGNIYKKEQAQEALGHFFNEKNLTALREIALRRCADRVNKMAVQTRLTEKGDYYTDEHILVCLSSSPTNPKIIRAAARMANALNSHFTALFVEMPDYDLMSEENKSRLQSNRQLAEQLGARVEIVYGEDVPLLIAEFARVSGVSKIVIGRSSVKRGYIWGKQTLTEKLILAAPNLDIYIIPDREAIPYKAQKTKTNMKLNMADMMKSIFLLILATAIGFVFYHFGFSEATIIMLYILCVLITAIVTTEKVYSLTSSVVSVLIFNFFYTVPQFSLKAYESGYPVTFLIMFITAFIVSTLAMKIKQQAKQSAETAHRTNILLETNQFLQKAHGRVQIVDAAAKQLMKLLNRDILFYLADEGELLKPFVYEVFKDSSQKVYTNQNEQAVASWVFKNNQAAGATTNTLGGAMCLYLPVRVNENVYGVVGIETSEQTLDSFENSITLSILGDCALSLENDRVMEEREQAAVLAKNEQLRANLLRSISHDLRTPLTTISGNADILMTKGDTIEQEKKHQLYMDIYDESIWLINLVENLLSVTRIEDGSMHLNLTTELMDEIIAEALRHINRNRAGRQVSVNLSEDFIFVKVDAKLIVQVILNIVDNASKYTPAGTEVTINVLKNVQMAMVDISDTGDGIADEVKEKVFDMFYTAGANMADSRRSLGLGLALCKSIIMAHGGEITVLDNQPKGTVIRFTLPLKEVALHE